MNFKHLHYFWVAAKAGGVVRAGEQLHTTPQTLSSQIKLLEDRLGRRLFRKSGRNLELTDDGRVALRFADEIFSLGSELEASLRQKGAAGVEVREFRVGMQDTVAKTVGYRLLEPALSLKEPVRLICTEGRFPDLMAQLALHRVDLVIADEPLTSRLNVKAFNHKLGSSPMTFYAAPHLAATLRGTFPHCLTGAPMLLPGTGSSTRPQLEAWLTRHQIAPRVVGEFEDGALMKAFGRQGAGVFLAPSVVEPETAEQYGVLVIGHTSEVVEDLYAITAERRIKHPGVVAITESARGELFGSQSA